MHTLNLEQLAVLVRELDLGGERWAAPDMMIGTDSHTPMINGIGVLGWGVGGLEAQTVMFGMPTMLRIPDVIGVELTGALPPGALATDLALTVTQRLRQIGVSGEFVEFFGPGVATLSAGSRAVVANMAPEYGATTGYFPPDERTLDYLRQTGRSADALDLARAYLRRNGLWFDPQARPRYTRTITIALDGIASHAAGHAGRKTYCRWRACRPRWPRAAARAGPADGLPAYPVAIAAITSCTNTSDPALLIAAGLLARKARARGLAAAPWVKTSLGPGSPAAASYLRRAGLMDDLSAIGFDIVGYGCTTCIGNSGPLPERVARAAQAGQVRPVAILSGNRNFPGRVHPDLELGFLVSPPLVIAYALAGDAERDLDAEPLGVDADGAPVLLRDIWPRDAEIQACLDAGLDAADFARDFQAAQANRLACAGGALGHALSMAAGLHHPAPSALRGAGRRQPARPLHGPSAAGAGRRRHHRPHLASQRHSARQPGGRFPGGARRDRRDLNVFASRRGNWEVMLRAAFHSRSLVNLYAPVAPVARCTRPRARRCRYGEAARYRDAGLPVVLVAGERYGTGSSRDWAARASACWASAPCWR